MELCGTYIITHLWYFQADLWSVGAILYQLVIGKPPFDGNSQLQVRFWNFVCFFLRNSVVDNVISKWRL